MADLTPLRTSAPKRYVHVKRISLQELPSSPTSPVPQGEALFSVQLLQRKDREDV